MIEFTLSRVCMGICGLILLSVVFVPTMNLFDNGHDESIERIAGDIAKTVDRFSTSKAETMTISLRDLLPESSSIRFKENLVTIEKDGKQYHAFAIVPINECGFGRNDIIMFEKTGQSLYVRGLD